MGQGQSRQARYKKARYILYGFTYRIFSKLKSLVVENRVGGVCLGEGTAGGKRICLQKDNRVPSG